MILFLAGVWVYFCCTPSSTYHEIRFYSTLGASPHLIGLGLPMHGVVPRGDNGLLYVVLTYSCLHNSVNM